MLNRLIIIISSIILLCFAAESAEISLFLQPKVTAFGKNLLLSDIASIEGNYSSIDQIKNINIEHEIFSDGYIDKKEITTLLKKCNLNNFIIYGNAVHVIDDLQTDKTLSDQSELILKKGDRVEIILNNKGVSLILKGVVVNEGRFNEEIGVRIENKWMQAKVIKAKVIGKDLVEVNI